MDTICARSWNKPVEENKGVMSDAGVDSMLPNSKSPVVVREKKTCAKLSNPFLNYLFNHQDFKNSGPLKEVMNRICENPGDYAILVPSTMFLMLHVDKTTGRPYSEVCQDLEFVLTHIVRLNVEKEPRIRTHKEFTTLSNKTMLIKDDTINSLSGFKFPVNVKILKQNLLRGFIDYIPLGQCFHLVYISGSMMSNYRAMGPTENLMLSSHSNNVNVKKAELGRRKSQPKKVKPFELIIGEYPGLLDIAEKFRTLFNEYTFKKCRSSAELENSFVTIMKRGSAMFNTLDRETFTAMLKYYSEDELRESVYIYLEMNVYDRFWARFVKLTPNDEDKRLLVAYDKLKWLGITQIGLPESITENIDTLLLYIKRAVAAVREFKLLNFSNSSSLKCSIICKTVDILSANSFIDADTLITLLIFVICISKVNDLNSHLAYIKKYSYSEINTETGMLGYALSSLEVAMKYFHEDAQLQRLVSKSLRNEVLWRLIGAVSSDHSNASNKIDDEKIFIQLEQLLTPLNDPNLIISQDNFVRSRTLAGESCLMFALKQNNEELMNVLLQFEYIFTLDDILEDKNIEGSNLLAVALDLEHPYATVLAQMVLQATVPEIEAFINQPDRNGRTVGHLLYNSYLLISDFGMYMDWTKRDNFGNTPLMVNVRCYDHPKYDEMMSITLPTVSQWYIKKNKLFSHREHLDNKGNTLMHMMRDSKTLGLFLDTFKGLEMNYINDANQSAVSLAVRYNRIENIKILLKDPRVCLSVVDPVMYMSALDYVKLERWGECVNREIAKLLEVQFIVTEYGESLDIACVRARFEPEHGLCCYFRVVNKEGNSDIILVPFSSIVKVFKLLKKENPCIPFDFNKPDIWFPRHSYVTMKGNISSSNKMKINSLINNLNLLVQALYKNGTLDHTETLQNYLLVPQEPGKLEVKPLNDRNVVKNIYAKTFSYKKNIMFDKLKFNRMILKSEDIYAYEAFLEYTVNELNNYSELYHKFYKTFTLSDIEAKDLDILRTDMPWIIDECLKRRECRVEDSSDIFLDKIRLLYASVNELIKVSNEMKVGKLRRWKKLVGDLKTVRIELDRIAGSGVDGSVSPSPYNGPVDPTDSIKNSRKDILSKVFKQIDVLTSESSDRSHVEELRKDIIRVVFRGTYTENKDVNLEEPSGGLDFTTEAEIDKSLEELIDLDGNGIGSWFSEKRRISYVRRLLETFLKYRLELVELDIELRKNYENLAMFMSQFYQFRIDLFKNAFRYYAKGKMGELKREVKSWELDLRERRSANNMQ